MELPIYKEIVQSVRDDVRADSDTSDEEMNVRCESCGSCGSDGSDAYGFYRRASFGRRDADTMDCSGCDSGCGKGKQRSQKGKHSMAHRIRWADECNKELARQNPRKRYTKKPINCPPLKPILKTH